MTARETRPDWLPAASGVLRGQADEVAARVFSGDRRARWKPRSWAWIALSLLGLSGEASRSAAQCTTNVLSQRDTAWAVATSADGSVVVGNMLETPQGSTQVGFRWTLGNGLQPLPSLGDPITLCIGVSADGNVMAGNSHAVWEWPRAVRWGADGGITALGTFGGENSEATDISSDGSTIVGWANGPPGPDAGEHAFRWTSASGLVNLGTLGGYESAATAVSANGAVVVGWSTTAPPVEETQALRWTATAGMQSLGTPGEVSAATSVSEDGDVVVSVWTTGGFFRPFRWTASTGMQDLGTIGIGSAVITLPPGAYFPFGSSLEVSADGSVVVGAEEEDEFPNAQRAWRWTAATGMQELGGGYSSPKALSADGGVVVGVSFEYEKGVLSDGHAFRWALGAGMNDIGGSGSGAYGVSADGMVVVGAAITGGR